MGGSLVVSRQVLTSIPKKDDCSRKIIANMWTCPGCSAEYTEDCLPRNLNCGHTICSKCAENALGRRMSCFECFAKQSFKNLSYIPVNYPLRGVVNSREIREIFSKVEIPSIFSNNHRYKDTWNCGEHGDPILYLCYICNTWICNDCLVVDHVTFPRGSCRTITVENGIRRVKEEYIKKVNEILKDIEVFRKTSEVELGIHAFCLEHCPCNFRKHERLVPKTEKRIEKVKKSSASLVEDGKNKVQEKLKSFLYANTSPEEMATLITEILSYADELKQKFVKEMLPVTKLVECHLRMVIKLLVKMKSIVYALQQDNHGTRWAPLTIHKKRLLLHSLRDGSPPDDGFIIPYEYARRLVPRDQTTIFLEFGTEEESSGFVYFNLIYHMKYSEQLALMCSGEKGVSHKGTYLFGYDEETLSLQGGDYQKNDGTGGTTIIQGLEYAYESIYKYRVDQGTIFADAFSTRFNICMRTFNINTGLPGIMGHVQYGLKSLRNLLKVKIVTQIMIRDCGLFIPVNVGEMADVEEEEEREEE